MQASRSHDAMDRPRPAGPGRPPADLEPHETAVAEAFGTLRCFEGGDSILDAVRLRLAEAEAAPALGRPALAGRWWVGISAAAAAVLLAFGALALHDPVETPSDRPVARTAAPARTLVIEDPSMTLYHGLETFEGVAVEPGDLLALGDE